MDCTVDGRKYVLISQPSRWQKKRERVVVQSPLLNIPKDVSIVPVRRFNGEQQNAVCYLPRTDFEKDSSDAYRRTHVSNSPSSIEAHGIAICENSPSEDFLYSRNDRFWIYVDSRTEEYKDTVPVINLRTHQNGVIQIEHVCWFPKIKSTSMCSVTKSSREQLWTPGGSARQCKLSGSKKYAMWSFVICQYTDGTQPVGKSVMIPTKDNQTEETRHLSINESNILFEARWRGMIAEPSSSCPIQPLTHLLPTPPASPELETNTKMEKGKTAQRQPNDPLSIDKDCWARIVDMASRRAFRSNHYILRNSPIHPQRSLSEAGSETRGRSAALDLHTDEYEDDSNSDLDSIDTCSRDVSPDRIPTAEILHRASLGRFYSEGIDFFESLKRINSNEVYEGRNNRLAFSAADPLIANDPTRIHANWEANQPEHNPKLDGLCQNNDRHCPYTTKCTRRHYHPDPAKCRLDKPPLLEHHEPSHQSLDKQWDAWLEANNGTLPPDRYVDHEHCITRMRPYPAGAGDCLLAANPRNDHRCCVWDEADFVGIPQNFTRAYNRSKHAEAQRHRIAIFDQSKLVKTEIRLPDHGLMKDQLDLGGQTFHFELENCSLGSELGHLEMDQINLESDDRIQDNDRFWNDDSSLC